MVLLTCLRAKCKLCQWEVKASGEEFLALAVDAHHANTGHRVKIRS